MNAVIVWAKGNPTRVVAIATVLLGWAAAAGVPDIVIGGLGTILAVLIGGPVYNAVTPVAKAAATARAAAHDAAAQIASRLDTETAGPAGAITDHAAELVDTAADAATAAALRGIGVRRRAA